MFTFPVAIYSQGSAVSLAGDVGISAAIAANLSTGALLGNVGISASIAGSLSLAKPLVSGVSIAATLAGDTTLAKPLTGDVAIASSLAGDTSLTKSLAGSISVSAALAGNFYNTLLLNGDVAIASSLAGDTTLAKPLTGATAISSSLAGSMSLTKVLAGDTAISSSLSGALFDPATSALLARFSGSYSAAQQAAIDALISGLKTDSLWSTIDVLHIVAGSTAQADALLNWKSSSYNLSITGSLTYTKGLNFSGFTTSNYLSDGFVPSSAGGNFAQNSATIAIYSTGDGQSSNVAIGGNNSASAIHSQIVLRNSSNQAAITNNATTSQTSSATNTVYTAVGLTTNTRTASGAIALYKNSSSIATGSTTSTGNLSVQVFTGAQNNNATPASADTNLALVAEVKASGWNSTQVGNFYSRLNTYLQTLKTTSYTLTYSSDGDANGLFYLLGANMGMQAWTNPAYNSNTDTSYSNNAAIILSASSVGGGNLNVLCDRATSLFYTSNVAGSWVKADIGKFRSLSVSKYSIRNYNTTGDWLRSWKLQGSNDNSTWTDIDVRTSDTTFNAANVWYSITPNQGVNTSFQFFRILNTGLTSSSSNYLSLGEWELYGSLTIGTPTTFTNSGLNGDQNGIIYYLASTQAAENWPYGWVNPHATGIVTVSASSVGGGNVSQIVSRIPNGFFTNNSAGSWIQIDFGASRTVRVDSYQLRNYNLAVNLLRNWKIQGSTNGSTWTDLDVRTSDTTLTAANQWGNWTVNQGNTSFWRYVRLLSTGVDSGSANYICLGQIELYGAIA